MVGFDGGELEKMYKRLADAQEKSQARADAVHERIRKVENVARSLFSEWKDEIDEYTDDSLRRKSERDWRETKQRYDELMVVMKRAAEPMEPVLAKLNDQVLFLKHNLNARALGSLETSLSDLEASVAELVEEMQSSIAEADAFINEMNARNTAT